MINGKKTDQMHKLVWIVNGVIKETIETNKPYAVCKWKANQLKNTTHTTGLLLVQLME